MHEIVLVIFKDVHTWDNAFFASFPGFFCNAIYNWNTMIKSLSHQ